MKFSRITLRISTVIGFSATLGVLAASANAQSIGIAFGNAVLATDSPGVIAGTNFNDFAAGSGTSLALNNSTGAATAAKLTFNSSGFYNAFDAPSTSNAGTNRLYSNGLFGSNTSPEVSITVTGVSFTSYDVYVYSGSDTANTSTLGISDGTTTFFSRSNGSNNAGTTALTQTTSKNSGAPTVADVQYQIFHETSPTFTLTTSGSSSGVLSNNVFGLQIVNSTASAPEPGAVLLLVSGVPCAFAGLARRRKAA